MEAIQENLELYGCLFKTQKLHSPQNHKVEISYMKDPISEWVCSTKDQGPGGQVTCENLPPLYTVEVEGVIIMISVLWMRKLKLRRAQ